MRDEHPRAPNDPAMDQAKEASRALPCLGDDVTCAVKTGWRLWRLGLYDAAPLHALRLAGCSLCPAGNMTEDREQGSQVHIQTGLTASF